MVREILIVYSQDIPKDAENGVAELIMAATDEILNGYVENHEEARITFALGLNEGLEDISVEESSADSAEEPSPKTQFSEIYVKGKLSQYADVEIPTELAVKTGVYMREALMVTRARETFPEAKVVLLSRAPEEFTGLEMYCQRIGVEYQLMSPEQDNPKGI